MKWIHNEKVSLAWAVVIEVLVHAIFALQAFLLGGFLGEVALSSFFGRAGAWIGAVALAVFIFGAAFQAFVLGEYMKEHVESFEETGKDGSYRRNWKALRWLVGGLEISSLAFRVLTVAVVGDYLQSAVIAVAGVLILWYAYAQAKVIHASVNRPVEYDVMRAQAEAGRSLVKDALDFTGDMSPRQKARFAGGDVTAVEEVASARFFEEEQAQSAKKTRQISHEEAEREKQEQTRRARGMASRLFDPSTWGQRDDEPDFPDAQTKQSVRRLS